MLETQTTEKTLRYWLISEFFLPYDLDSELEDNKGELSIILEADEDIQLPWQDSVDNSGYIYFLPFDKADLTRLSKRKFNDPVQDYEINDEGLTCCARVYVNKEGVPDLGKFSISTLPWAMSLLSKGNIDQINPSNYGSSQLKLKRDITDILLNTSKLSSDSFKGIVEKILEWAPYVKEINKGRPLAYIKKFNKDKSKASVTEEKNSDNESKDEADAIDDILQEGISTTTVLPEEKLSNNTNESESETSLPILNSFFIEDLNAILNHKTPNNILNSYINGADENKRIDLYNPENINYNND